jgi:ribulose-5-phosphate 4-epimerase/fuculose-1-phosphate aldolase
MQFRVSPQSLENYSTEEWQARVDLAAAHRLAFNQGFSEGIFNHLTFVVPAKAVFHTHMPYASALTRLEDPRIKEIGQTEVGLSGAIAYDDEYTGPAVDPAEGARLARVIGDKQVLFMANHGISTVGASVAEAYDMLYYIERAAQVQIYAMWTGQRLKQLPEPVVEKTKREYKDENLYTGPTPAQRHFDALKRMLDRKEPDYAT